jgi:outer membrane protein OmpA-like peptidoglycan-associated protein
MTLPGWIHEDISYGTAVFPLSSMLPLQKHTFNSGISISCMINIKGETMKRLLLPGLMVIFLVSACTIPQQITQKEQTPGAVDTGSGATEIGGTIDRLERDMQRALSASVAAVVSREGDLITVTFLGDATFDTGSALVKPGLQAEIDRVARVLAQYPETIIRVEGHTDSKGSKEYNLSLSKQRADSVRTLLFKRGAGQRWIEVSGYGETKPIASNDTEEGRQKNRRVEVQVAPPR